MQRLLGEQDNKKRKNLDDDEAVLKISSQRRQKNDARGVVAALEVVV